MSAAGRAEVLATVASARGSVRRVLRDLGVSKSTYYRWRRRVNTAPPAPPKLRPISWNQLTSEEERAVLDAARGSPTWSSRHIAAWLTDHGGFSVSESTVYRLLRREGLVKPLELRMAAGKEYTRKTTGPHQMWATDASYFRVAGWGYYYMVSVMDDFSRFILAWRLQRDMTSDSLIEAVQDAVDATGMTGVPVEDRTKLLSDNGPGYISRAFRDYLGLLGIRHILAAPYHPQTNGKLERYHQTIKHEVNQVPYAVPVDLEAAIRGFVRFYNYERYHEALGDVTPCDVLNGRREEILRRRKEVQARTIQNRRTTNQSRMAQPSPALA